MPLARRRNPTLDVGGPELRFGSLIITQTACLVKTYFRGATGRASAIWVRVANSALFGQERPGLASDRQTASQMLRLIIEIFIKDVCLKIHS